MPVKKKLTTRGTPRKNKIQVVRSKHKRTNPRTHVYILLDRSGSMEWNGRWPHTIDAINGYVAELGDHDNISITLSVFDTHGTVHQPFNYLGANRQQFCFEVVRRISRMRDWLPLARVGGVIQPRGGTPLFDAIGRQIAAIETDETVQRGDRVVIAIMTDGQNNSSFEVTLEGAKAGLNRMRDRGHQVLFMGADFENMQQSADLGGLRGQTVSYSAHSSPVAMNFMARNTQAYASGAAATMDWSEQQRDELNKQKQK